jgi:hypothetical protein
MFDTHLRQKLLIFLKNIICTLKNIFEEFLKLNHNNKETSYIRSLSKKIEYMIIL